MEREWSKQTIVFEATDTLSADALRGRQSVRATFRLPVASIELLSHAANQLGLKQKSLFDQLVEDREILERLALGAGNYQPDADKRQQKTYVVSRNALVALEYVAKNHGLPRDLLVEISIQRLLPVIHAEQEKQARRKALQAELHRFLEEGRTLAAKALRELAPDEEVVVQLQEAVAQVQEAAVLLAEAIERGRILEQYLER